MRADRKKQGRALPAWRWGLGIATLLAASSVGTGCTDSGAIVGGVCGGVYLECDGACVNPLVDPNHCGGCGVNCNGGACEDGVCGAPPPCPPGLVLCDGECVDLTTNPDHCGWCGNQCNTDVQHCEPGASGKNADCVCNDPTLTVCGDECVDLTSDPNHCGACGNACNADDQVCEPQGEGYACVCEDPSLVICDGVCVDLSSNMDHCGACGNACHPMQDVCKEVGGEVQCVPLCEPPLTACPGPEGRFCTNLQDDWQNCGACGNVCSLSGLCQAGVCRDGTAGHIVILGMSFKIWTEGSSPSRILQNAAFLPAPAANPVRVLTYAEYADDDNHGSVQRVEDLLAWASADLGYPMTVHSLPTNGELAYTLSIDSHDVLLIHDQVEANETLLEDIGSQWSQTLDNYARAGGIIIVLVSHKGPGDGPSGMPGFLRESDLLPGITGSASATWHNVLTVDPGSAIAKAVATQFLAMPSTTALTVESTDPDPNTTEKNVVVDAPPNTEAPIVIHKTVTP